MARTSQTTRRLYPLKFHPIYMDRIWGGRNFERLLGRRLPEGRKIGESWELADLKDGASVVANGPLAGKTLTELTQDRQIGPSLLGDAQATPAGRFPLLLKYLDANDTLSLQVHPDAKAVADIGGDAALKTEGWYIIESRNGFIYRGVLPGVTREAFGQALRQDKIEGMVRRMDVAAGEFHFLPAGTVHALGAGVLAAEVQTPSDTTYRVTDWGRGRETHVERSMQCIQFEPSADTPPGATGPALVDTEFFRVEKLSGPGALSLSWRCAAIMHVQGRTPLRIEHDGEAEPNMLVQVGETVLVAASLNASVQAGPESVCLVIYPKRGQ